MQRPVGVKCSRVHSGAGECCANSRVGCFREDGSLGRVRPRSRQGLDCNLLEGLKGFERHNPLGGGNT